jgi:hypothetical protein
MALLDAIVAAHAEDNRSMQWRIERAMSDIDPLPPTRKKFLASLPRQKEILKGLLPSARRIEDEVQIRSALAQAGEELGDTQGILDQALAIRESLKPLPGRLDLRRHLSKLFFRGGDLPGAVAELEYVFAKHPDSDQAPGALLDLALLYYRRSGSDIPWEQAFEAVQKSLDLIIQLAERYPGSAENRQADEDAFPAIQRRVQELVAKDPLGREAEEGAK